MKEKDRFSKYIEEQTYIELTKEENISREELINWCLELGLNKDKKVDSKLMIKDNLLEFGITYLDFYNRFKDRAYGIHPSRFSNKFRVNNYQRKKMVDTNFIKVAYYKDEEIFPGRIEKVPFFNPEWYFSINFNDIEIWRADNIKGYNNKQLRMDI
ncbi:MAG: hypothetical protein NSGCLCUN01_03718 [uncultured Clostridium sp.]